jgi:addiction module HigA family antidote
MGERLPPVHPGEVILEDYLKPLRKTPYWLARQMHMSPIAVSRVLRGQRSVTPATALKLEKVIGSSAEFWMGLQVQYDLERERERLAPELEMIHRYVWTEAEVHLEDDRSEPVRGTGTPERASA